MNTYGAHHFYVCVSLGDCLLTKRLKADRQSGEAGFEVRRDPDEVLRTRAECGCARFKYKIITWHKVISFCKDTALVKQLKLCIIHGLC